MWQATNSIWKVTCGIIFTFSHRVNLIQVSRVLWIRFGESFSIRKFRSLSDPISVVWMLHGGINFAKNTITKTIPLNFSRTSPIWNIQLTELSWLVLYRHKVTWILFMVSFDTSVKKMVRNIWMRIGDQFRYYVSHVDSFIIIFWILRLLKTIQNLFLRN